MLIENSKVTQGVKYIFDLGSSWKKNRTNEKNNGEISRYIDELIGVIHLLEKKVQQSSTVGVTGKTLVAGLAHDLRNPLAVIRSCSQYCLEHESLPPETRENIQMIFENSKKVSNLLNQFLKFSKVDLAFIPLDINQIIQNTWKLAILDKGNSMDPKICFHAHLAQNLPEILGDAEKIERVFLNLFLNAIEAVGEISTKREITAQSSLLSSRSMIEVKIIDNGIGISDDIREIIFTPFFTTKREGIGLGLHLCQYFVEQHQGEILIESTKPGKTEVTVRLPISSQSSV
jgi:signal transduction histidine kinase